MLYNKYSRTLTIDNIDECNEHSVCEFINAHIDEVLYDGSIHLNPFNGELQVIVFVDFQGYFVALYVLTDGYPDEFIIQPLGYNQALNCAK